MTLLSTKVSLRDFRKSMVGILNDIFMKRTSVTLTKNEEERAVIIPPQMKLIIDTLAQHIDMKSLMDNATTGAAVWQPFKQYFMESLLSEEAPNNSPEWIALSHYFMDHILLERNPPQYSKDLASARVLWSIGSNLRRLIPGHISDLRKVLERGGEVNAIFVDPKAPDAIKYVTIQENGYHRLELMASLQVDLINNNCIRLIELANTVKLGKLSCFKIDYPPACGIDFIFSHNEMDDLIYVRNYPLNDDDKPILRLTRHNQTWFDFYSFQLNRYKQAARPMES